MIIERSMHPAALSNTYLAGTPGAGGFFVDAGGPVQPLIEAARRQGIEPTHVLLTHHHSDHVWDLPQLIAHWPGLRVLIEERELAALRSADEGLAELVTGTMQPDHDVELAGYNVTPLPTPGHTAGMLSLLVEGNVFTGDTLFKGSVGGVRAPGSTSYDDLRASIMETLMGLPPETIIRPGHSDPTTVGEEWESNAFVRVWRGLDPEGDKPCRALGEPATLVLLGDDYDGGHKAWIRWPDGRDDIVPGSKIE